MGRRLAALLAVVLGPGALAGDGPCRADGLVAFPAPGAVVPTNAVFILEGAGALQSSVADLPGARGVVLRPAEGADVAVRVEKGWVSQASRVAVKLRPLRALEPGTVYRLVAEALAGQPVLNDAGGLGLSWQTGPGQDTSRPRYTVKPAVAQGRYLPGPPPTRELTLHVGVADEGPTYLEVSMQRMRGSSVVQRYPVPVVDAAAVLGHDACGGTMGFEDGRAYRLTLELVDSAGNRGRPVVKLEVSAPRP